MAGIFDKVTNGLNKGVATVSVNSKAMIEKTQVKAAIKNLETERKQLAELLGMKVYESYQETNALVLEESMLNFFGEIQKRLQGIAEQEAILQRIEDEVNLITGAKTATQKADSACTCGHISGPGLKFCVKCGSPL